MLVLVTGATGKVGRHFIERFLGEGRFAAGRIRALCHNRMLEPSDRIEVVRGSIADRARRRCGDGGRDACPASRHLQGNARRRHGRHGEGPVLAARGVPHVAVRAAVHPDRRRRGGRAFLLRPRRARHRGDAAPRLSRLLRAVQGAGRGDAAAILHPVRHQRLLPARAVDHGEGRLQVHALLRRRRVRRAGMEGRGAGGSRGDLPRRPARSRSSSMPKSGR